MNRSVRITRGRLLTRAAVAAATLLSAAALPAAAEAGRSNDLAKDVVIVSGPEVPTHCTATEKLEWAISLSKPSVDGKQLRWTGKFKHIHVNPLSNTCAGDGTVRIEANTLQAAAIGLSRQLEAYSEKQAVDVVALGTGGTVLRYALLMAARKRAGLTAFGATDFAERLDVEDVVTLGSPLDGAAFAPASCGGGGLCDDLVRPPAHVQKPIHWQLMDSNEQSGKNPQGIGGTDWSVIGLAGDRFAPPETSTGMDANHKTIYEDEKLTFLKALVDNDEKTDAKLRYLHAPATEFEATNKGRHVLHRIAQDVVYGTASDDDKKGEGPAYAEGCSGFNEGGATVVRDPKLLGWTGDKRAVRVVKTGTIDAVANCFRADPKKKDTFFVYGEGEPIRINGIDFFLRGFGSRLEINVKTRTVKRAGGKIDVEIPITADRSLPIWTFPGALTADLDWKFPNSGDGVIQSDDGSVFSLSSPEFSLLGMKTTGEIALKVDNGSIALDLSLALPGLFSSKLAPGAKPECDNGIDDDKDGEKDVEDEDCDKNPLGDYEDRAEASALAATVTTNNEKGLNLEKVSGSIGGAIKLGPFRSEGSIGVSYSWKDKEWQFAVSAALPALSDIGVKLKVGIRDGELSSIYGELNGLSIPLWSSGWYVQKLGLGLSGLTEGQQLQILISVGVSFLKKIAGEYLIYIEGDVTIGWGTPWKFGLSGSLSVLDDRYGSGSLEFEQGVGGKLNLQLGREIQVGPEAVFIPQGTLTGQMGLTGELDIGATIQACFKGKFLYKEFEDPFCFGKTEMRLTRYIGQPISQAVCFRTSLALGRELSVGFVTTYDIDPKAGFRSKINFISNSCDVGDYGAKKSQASADTGGFTIAPGTKERVVTIKGEGGRAPNVALVAPDGRRIAAPDEPVKQLSDEAFGLTIGGQTTFVLANPREGRWTVETQPGSVPVTSVDQLDVLPEPKVSAGVHRERHGLKLDYDVAAAPGQLVRFVEKRDGLIKEIARTNGGKASKRFTPAFGPAGKRDIVAIVEQDGRVRKELQLGSYVAPAPAKPGKVKTITVKRKGHTVSVTWSKAKLAQGGYEVNVRLPDGRTYAQITKARKVVVKDVIVDGKAEVRVRALRKDEVGGPVKAVARRI